MHEHRLSGSQPHELLEQEHRRRENQRRRGGLFRRDRIRDRDRKRGRHHGYLGKPTASGDRRYSVADPRVGHAVANGAHRAHDLEPGDVRPP